MGNFKFGDKIWVNSADDIFESGFFTIVKSASGRYDKGSVVDKDGFLWIWTFDGNYPIEQRQVEPDKKESQ